MSLSVFELQKASGSHPLPCLRAFLRSPRREAVEELVLARGGVERRWYSRESARPLPKATSPPVGGESGPSLKAAGFHPGNLCPSRWVPETREDHSGEPGDLPTRL